MNQSNAIQPVFNWHLTEACNYHCHYCYAWEIGFELSAITNGSLLNLRAGSELLLLLGWLGGSIDSIDKAVNLGIGRISRGARILNLKQLKETLEVAKQKNPKLRLKLNTVVNKLNYNQDLSPLIRSLAPEKWKLLRLLPVVDSSLVISEQQFQCFVLQNIIICAEDKQDMGCSYLMVDPYGRFFQNRLNTPQAGYVCSSSILDVGATDAFSEIEFCTNRFAKRYRIQIVERRA